MNPRRTRIVSIVSAGCLAVLTLLVFLASLNTGPASSVIRFNEAIVKRDKLTLRNVAAGQLDSDRMQYVIRTVQSLVDPQTKLEVIRVDRKNDDAIVSINYKSPRYNVINRYFAVHRWGRTWLIDSNKTAALFARQQVE